MVYPFQNYHRAYLAGLFVIIIGLGLWALGNNSNQGNEWAFYSLGIFCIGLVIISITLTYDLAKG
jgi:hypothetical protein